MAASSLPIRLGEGNFNVFFLSNILANILLDVEFAKKIIRRLLFYLQVNFQLTLMSTRKVKLNNIHLKKVLLTLKRTAKMLNSFC